MVRRFVPLTIVLSLLFAYLPAPALAVSTQTEIEMGKEYDEQIVQSNVVETDPLLNAYVQRIANNIWNQTARKDVPYNVKIIKATDVNSFATLGGYIYLYEGMIDFVQSDDELAGVIGHETGHIERRHVITSNAKEQALNLLFGVASIFNPFIYDFGSAVEAGIVAKMSREDEIEADRTGLQLMSRAGYDPNAMLTMLQHIGTLEDAHESVVDKYLADHPDAPARIAKLEGYPELDPTKVSQSEMLVRALGDEERARYNMAMLELTKYQQKYPGNPEVLLQLSQAQLALGQTSKSEQTLSEVVQTSSPQVRADVAQHMAALRNMELQSLSLSRPDLPKLRALMAQTQEMQSDIAAQIEIRRQEGDDELKTVQQRVDAVGYELPDMSNIEIRPGSRLDAIEANLEAMSRSVNSALEDAGVAIDAPGSLEKGKETGLLESNSDILGDMQAPLNMTPIPTDSIAIFPSYPSMLADMQRSDADMLRSVDAGRAALVVTSQALGNLDAFLKRLDVSRIDFNGDISKMDGDDLASLEKTASDSLNAAATAAAQAAQLLNLARARQISVRITLLGVGTSPQRYQTLQYALQQRIYLNGISYDEMLKQNLTPGDVAAATIIAADFKTTPQVIIDEAKANGRTIIDDADARGMHAWPLEIFMGLTYLNYTDDPVDEMKT